jgi:hypothetical protein
MSTSSSSVVAYFLLGLVFCFTHLKTNEVLAHLDVICVASERFVATHNDYVCFSHLVPRAVEQTHHSAVVAFPGAHNVDVLLKLMWYTSVIAMFYCLFRVLMLISFRLAGSARCVDNLK